MKPITPRGLIYACALAAALGLCGCSRSSSPANQTYIPPSTSPPPSAVLADSSAPTSSGEAAPPASGLTVTPPASSGRGAGAASGAGDIPRLAPHRRRRFHSSTDGERG